MKNIGLTLGGGGARGLCHIEFLIAFDDLKLKPSVISGTSIGAIIGAFYAAGLSGREIKKILDKIDLMGTRKEVKSPKIVKEERKLEKFVEAKFHEFKEYFNKIDNIHKMIDLSFFRSTSFLQGKGVEKFLEENLPVKTFEELKIPLKIVATDFWQQKQVIFDSGDLIPAIRASMSIPAVFEPVIIDGKVLIDGGITNNLPYDIIQDDCKLIIAIDVSGTVSTPTTPRAPNLFDNIMLSFDILQNSIIRYQMKIKKPDIYIQPELMDIGILDFHRANEILNCVKIDVDKLLLALKKHSNRRFFGFQFFNRFKKMK
jgi:NTE family protein